MSTLTGESMLEELLLFVFGLGTTVSVELALSTMSESSIITLEYTKMTLIDFEINRNFWF